MKLVRFDPMSLFRDFDRLLDFSDFGSSLAEVDGADWLPRIDVSDGDDGVIIRAEIPGVDPAAVDITIDGDLLTMEGSKSVTTEDEGEGYRRREIFEGSFRRSIRLPFSADPSMVKASATNGILEIKIPRVDEPAPQKISVDVD